MRTGLKALAFALSLSALPVLAHADSHPLTERDDCISNLRGHAEINARLNGYTVLRIVDGEFSEKSDGGVKCSARFEISKENKSTLTDYMEGEVAKRDKK